MDLLNARKDFTNWVRTEPLDAYRHWTIVTVGEHQWLVRVQNKGSFYYGMFISLDEMAAIFKKDIEFQSLKVQYNDTDVDKTYISAAGEVENGDLMVTLAVEKKEIIHGLPRLQFVAILVGVPVCTFNSGIDSCIKSYDFASVKPDSDGTYQFKTGTAGIPYPQT